MTMLETALTGLAIGLAYAIGEVRGTRQARREERGRCLARQLYIGNLLEAVTGPEPDLGKAAWWARVLGQMSQARIAELDRSLGERIDDERSPE